MDQIRIQSEHKTDCDSKGVTPVLLFSSAELSDYVSVKNLLDYALFSLKNSTGYRKNRKEALEHFRHCIRDIGSMTRKNLFAQCSECSAMLDEFTAISLECLVEVEEFQKTHPGNESDNEMIELKLMSRVTTLQWLSLCISDEIKRKIQR